MRIISALKIRKVISCLCQEANFVLRKDVLAGLKEAYRKETNQRAKEILGAIIKNAQIARQDKIAICQDTGFPCVFVEIGEEVRIAGDLKTAINQGVALGYRLGFLRNSLVKDPLARGKPTNQPALIHLDLVKGKKIKITLLPKGFGCENKTRLKMFPPTAGLGEIKGFIIETVKDAGPDACPPYIVGVGIGGTADYACLLAKKALLRKITDYRLPITNYVKIERDLLKAINNLDIGPMGLGGKTTCLGVNILTAAAHIAGLAVCVNISCHALRSASAVI